MNSKFSYIKKLILISPFYFSIISFLLILEIGIISLSVLSLVPLADFILDPTLTNKSRITFKLTEFLNLLSVKPTFFLFSLFFIIFQILKGLVTIFINFAILKFKYDVLKKINNSSLDLLLNCKWNFFSDIDYGFLSNTFVKEINNIGNTVGQLANGFASITKFLIYLSVPLYINFNITITIIFLIIMIVVPLIKFSGPLSFKFGKMNTETANYMMISLSEIMQGLKFILVNSRNLFFRNSFLQKFNLHANATIRSQVLATSVNAFFQPAGVLVIIIVFGFFLSSGIVLSEIAAIFYSLISVISATNVLVGINININNFIPSYMQLNKILNKAQKFQRKNGEIQFEGLKKNISFKNICFNYKDKRNVIQNISFEIRKNSITSIVGKSGSGKSTLIDLLVGVLDQNEGSIKIDNEDLRNIDLISFREKIAYVTQDTILFNDTIENNLKLISSKKFKTSDIWKSLEAANLKTFVKKLPQQLKTKIGERGVQFSGGQKQRLSLARALLKKPTILILDEATSSLDSLSENEIYKTIDKLLKKSNVTIIIIAHKLSTLKHSDKIIVIDKGKLIEEGKFNYLKNKKNSFFNKMLKLQLKK
jgi:ABC-type bacteriocin/lantibiotic exporter with double-glycine peptidase domain